MVTGRLRKTCDIRRVFRHGTLHRGRLLRLYVLPQPTEVGVRFTVVAGAKVGGAVCRNRLKRRLREIVWHECTGDAGGADFILAALPPARDATFWELRAAALELMGRARLAPSAGLGLVRFRQREG